MGLFKFKLYEEGTDNEMKWSNNFAHSVHNCVHPVNYRLFIENKTVSLIIEANELIGAHELLKTVATLLFFEFEWKPMYN